LWCLGTCILSQLSKQKTSLHCSMVECS